MIKEAETLSKNNFFDRYIRPLIRHKVFSLVLILLALVVLFTVWSEIQGGKFFKASTLKNVLNSIVLTAFLTIGAGCLLISGNLDLSQAAVGAFGGVILAAAVANWHLPWFVGIILCLVFLCDSGRHKCTHGYEIPFPCLYRNTCYDVDGERPHVYIQRDR